MTRKSLETAILYFSEACESLHKHLYAEVHSPRANTEPYLLFFSVFENGAQTVCAFPCYETAFGLCVLKIFWRLIIEGFNKNKTQNDSVTKFIIAETRLVCVIVVHTFSCFSKLVGFAFESCGNRTDKITFSSVMLNNVSVHEVWLSTCRTIYCCSARTASWMPRFVCGRSRASSAEL